MEFLNIGAGELLVLALIGLLLFGPEDLLKVARTVGGYVHKARQMWADVSTSLETELLVAQQEAEEASTSHEAGEQTEAEPRPALPDARPDRPTLPHERNEPLDEGSASSEIPDLP